MCLLTGLYSEAILRELEILPGFIIGGHNLNNIRYADDTVLIADTEKKLQNLLQKVAKESEKKGLSINYKKTECMVISKRMSPKCDLKVGDTRIKQTLKFKYTGSILAKDTFLNLGRVLQDREDFFGT